MSRSRSRSSSRAGLALLLALLHAVCRPRRVVRSKDAVGFIPVRELQLPLMPRQLQQQTWQISLYAAS